MTFEPLKVTGVITEDVGSPRNDGTPGSGLYKVPLRLSGRPSGEWTTAFVRAFDRRQATA